MSSRCPDNRRNPASVSKSGSDDSGPSPWIKVSELVKHSSAQTQPAQGVVIISPIQFDRRPMRIPYTQLRLVDLTSEPRPLPSGPLHVLPDGVLGLPVSRRDKSI